jgi:hypothetical protein
LLVIFLLVFFLPVLFCSAFGIAQAPSPAAQAPAAQTSTSQAASSQPRRKTGQVHSALDPGSVTNGIYHNRTLGLTCKIPPGWVLRTEEMNAPAAQTPDSKNDSADAAKNGSQPASSTGAKVLLAAFSRPPEAKGEDVNSSILIVAENAAAYPGLTDAAQYFFPLTEVAKAQGFEPDEDPYAVDFGTKDLVRGDFHKNVGTRVMRQSTLAMLSHGYAVSITMIGGTEDEVGELIDGLSFSK